MGAKITTETFIERAILKHGDKYDYSRVVYDGVNKEVEIICPVHGLIYQTPSCHLIGTGCRKCGDELRTSKKFIDTPTFIDRARKVHGNKYDYSLTEYTSHKSRLKIVCPLHGTFEQTPKKHLSGKGCRKCGNLTVAEKRSKSTEQFIEDAIEKHGNKYDYSLVDYKQAHKKVKIICKTHGVFEQTPTNHLTGYGCKKCATELHSNTRRSNTGEFIAKARVVHGDKYDYSLVDYEKNSIPVKIICPEHGVIQQTPQTHLSGAGCIYCAGVYLRDNEYFINRAIKVHGDKYKYEKSEYAGLANNVVVTCSSCGDFEVNAESHLNGSGCPSCSPRTRGFNYNLPGVVYYIRLDRRYADSLYKIGLTNRSVTDRFCKKDLAIITLIHEWYFEDGREASDFERVVLNTYSEYRYNGSDILLSGGNTELFTKDVLGLDTHPCDLVI